MNKRASEAIGVGVSLLYAALCYFVTESIVLSIVTLAVFLISILLADIPLLRKLREKERKRHEAYRFVRSFIITLSATSSPESAYQSASSEAKGELSDIISSLSSLSVHDRLESLKTYFKEPYYPVFCSLFALYEEQGGDILSIAEPLLHEVSRSEETSLKRESESRKAAIDYLVLWGLSSLILLFVRIGLANFYGRLLEGPIYPILVFVFFMMVNAGFYIFARAYAGKEEGKDEKPKKRKKSHAKKSQPQR